MYKVCAKVMNLITEGMGKMERGDLKKMKKISRGKNPKRY